MGKVYEEIDERLAELIESQHLFFVATAPLSAEGSVNLSPKGLDSFSILDPHTVAYLDLVGSGAETIAHLRENGRITILFCSFEGPPRLLRLYGRGEALEPGDEDFEALVSRFPRYPGKRSIIRLMTPRGMRYQDAYARAHPFNAMVDGMMNPQMVDETADIMRTAISDDTKINVIINNRAGGNAPIIAQKIARAFLADH